eukprot:Gb_19512 [translate_table: standard]
MWKIAMANTMKVVLVSGVVMMILMMGADADFQCGTVTDNLSPCLPFLTGKAAQPTPGCCRGIRNLNAAARTTPDRQAACNCIKSSAHSFGIDVDKGGKLPGLCHVNVGVPISASVDCARVH